MELYHLLQELFVDQDLVGFSTFLGLAIFGLLLLDCQAHGEAVCDVDHLSVDTPKNDTDDHWGVITV